MKGFNEGGLVLLLKFRLRLFPSKLQFRWLGSFEVIRVSESDAVEVRSESIGKFIVNGQRLKYYHPFNNVLEKIYTLIMCPP